MQRCSKQHTVKDGSVAATKTTVFKVPQIPVRRRKRRNARRTALGDAIHAQNTCFEAEHDHEDGNALMVVTAPALLTRESAERIVFVATRAILQECSMQMSKGTAEAQLCVHLASVVVTSITRDLKTVQESLRTSSCTRDHKLADAMNALTMQLTWRAVLKALMLAAKALEGNLMSKAMADHVCAVVREIVRNKMKTITRRCSPA